MFLAMDLSIQNIEFCKGVGAKRADILRKELGVKSALDMLYQFPYKYIDRSRFYFIHEIDDEDTYVQIIGHITEWHTIGRGTPICHLHRRTAYYRTRMVQGNQVPQVGTQCEVPALWQTFTL